MIVIKFRRRPTIRQAQIDDFRGNGKIEEYDMNVPRDYRTARKKFKAWLSVHPYTYHVPVAAQSGRGRQTSLLEYMPHKELPQLPRPRYLGRFRGIPQATFGEWASGTIVEREWDMFQAFPTFTGFFNHLFELNDLSYFDDVQAGLEGQGVSFKGIFAHDVVAFELLRRQLGFRDFTGIEKVARFVGGNPLAGVLRDPDFFPTAAKISYVMNRLPGASLVGFLHQLVGEGIELGVIVPRILIWDGQFIRSNSNNNRNPNTGKYTDEEAGFSRHVGKRLGVGYDPGILYGYCGPDRRLPVHFEMFPGNRNDKPAFRATVDAFLKLGIGSWKLVIADTGAYCQESLEFCARRGIYPLVRARKGLVEFPSRELKDGYWFNTDWIPEGWTDADVLEAYAWRPSIESGNAEHNTYYGGQRLNTRGIEAATRARALDYILDWLRALAARKLGRPDLTCKWSAYSSAREYVHHTMWGNAAQEAGYQTLPIPARERPTKPASRWTPA